MSGFAQVRLALVLLAVGMLWPTVWFLRAMDHMWAAVFAVGCATLIVVSIAYACVPRLQTRTRVATILWLSLVLSFVTLAMLYWVPTAPIDTRMDVSLVHASWVSSIMWLSGVAFVAAHVIAAGVGWKDHPAKPQTIMPRRLALAFMALGLFAPCVWLTLGALFAWPLLCVLISGVFVLWWLWRAVSRSGPGTAEVTFAHSALLTMCLLASVIVAMGFEPGDSSLRDQVSVIVPVIEALMWISGAALATGLTISVLLAWREPKLIAH